MKVILSRKGFDSAAGGCPSPIIGGRPVSLPIPTSRPSPDTYESIGLGDVVEKATRGRITRDHYCHRDPQYAGGRCAFGQVSTAQSHLANQGVGLGDVFLFFGLFACPSTNERHHRFFGWMQIDELYAIGADPDGATVSDFAKHPHLFGAWNPNNTIYSGPGGTAGLASATLRLTKSGGPLSRWSVPTWLMAAGLTYHGNPARWSVPGELASTARGQEFVTDITQNAEAADWLESIMAEMPA